MTEWKLTDTLGKEMRTLWIVWAAMLFSLFAYVRLCYLLEHEKVIGPRLGFSLALIAGVLYVAGIAELFLAYYFRRFLLKVRSDKSEERLIKRAAKLNKSPIIVKYSTAVITSLALSEVVRILGVVLFFLGRDFHTLYIFIAISAAAMLFFRPKHKELQQLSEAMKAIS